MGKFKDLTGMKFGKLTVIKRVENTKYHTAQFLCECECGNKKIIVGQQLTRKNGTKSCGCLKVERLIERNSTQDGLFKKYPRLYNIYYFMKQRCCKPNNKDYSYYGGRGIKICKEWENFKDFCIWSINNGYKENLTLDRINNNGNYEPSNCRWVTMRKQQNNTRNNHLLTYKGVSHTIAEWVGITGINRSTLCSRINSGWTIEKALTTPVKNLRKDK